MRRRSNASVGEMMSDIHLPTISSVGNFKDDSDAKFQCPRCLQTTSVYERVGELCASCEVERQTNEATNGPKVRK